MGVTGLKKLLKSKSSRSFFNIPITNFRGKRIAIDANNIMYMYMAVAQKDIIKNTDVAIETPNPLTIRKSWISSTLRFVGEWIRQGITPVFVFDGSINPMKMGTCEGRREKRNNAKTKIEVLRTDMRKDLLAVSKENVDKLRKELSNLVLISSDDADFYRGVLTSIGIPCLTAVDDAEKMCSILCHQKYVAAVYSKDGDCLAFNSPLIIDGYAQESDKDSMGYRIPLLSCIRVDNILEDLEFDLSQFIDMSIMMGCDYNNHKNIPGYGPVKCFNLISKFKSIDNLPSYLNISKLKHIGCREQFKHYDLSEDIYLDIGKMDHDVVHDYFELLGLTRNLRDISKIISEYNSTNDTEFIELNHIEAYIPPTSRFARYVTIETDNGKYKEIFLSFMD
jgi:flap endonuclease-1